MTRAARSLRRSSAALVALVALVACGSPPERPPLTVHTRARPEPPHGDAKPRDEALPELGAGAPATVEPPEWFTLPTSGVRVVYRRHGGIPRVTLGIFLRSELDDAPALRILYAGLLLRATGDVDTADWLEKLGVLVGRASGPSGAFVHATTIVPLFREVAEHVGANIVTPVLGGPRVAHARSKIHLAHELAQRGAQSRALAAATARLFPGAGYDAWYAGVPRSKLEAVNLDQLRALHAKTAVSERMVLSVVGPIPKDVVRDVLDRAFAGVRHGAPLPNVASPAPALPTGPVLVLDDADAAEAHALVALRGPAPGDADTRRVRADATAWRRVVWGSLRLRRGLSYDAGATWVPLPGASLVVARASIAPSDAAAAVRAIRKGFETRNETAMDAPTRAREEEADDDALELALGFSTHAKPTAEPTPLDVGRAVIVVVGDAKIVGPSLTAAGIPFEVRARE